MATTTQTRTHCPNCNAKLPEQPLSLCAYCAMPLDLAEGKEVTTASPNADRIAKVEQSDKLEAAMAWSPPESRQFRDGWNLGYRAKALAAGAAVTAVIAFLMGGGEGPEGVEAARFSTIWLFVTVLLVAASAFCWMKGAGLRKEALKLPLLKRAGVITDRRSDTTIKGWGGSTCYYFTIEMKDGVVGEFAYPGHGSNEEPYVSNLPGVAFTRGQQLLAFKHIRV